jgi:hypothetical protein
VCQRQRDSLSAEERAKRFPLPPHFSRSGVGVFLRRRSGRNKTQKNIMSSLVASSLEWLLKRALRFVVHRFLGRVLKSEVRGNDARQIDLVDGGALARFLRRRPSSLSFFRAPSARCLCFFLSLSRLRPCRVTTLCAESRRREKKRERKRARETNKGDRKKNTTSLDGIKTTTRTSTRSSLSSSSSSSSSLSSS